MTAITALANQVYGILNIVENKPQKAYNKFKKWAGKNNFGLDFRRVESWQKVLDFLNESEEEIDLEAQIKNSTGYLIKIESPIDPEGDWYATLYQDGQSLCLAEGEWLDDAVECLLSDRPDLLNQYQSDLIEVIRTKQIR